MFQILDELKEQSGVQQVIVAGGSMGGTAALAFATLHPYRVAGCVSLDGTVKALTYVAERLPKAGGKPER